MPNYSVPCALSILLGFGCAADPDDEPLGTATQEVVAANGTSLNGTSLNGTSLNGTSLNGTSLNGTSLNGTSLNGTSLTGVSVSNTLLKGVQGTTVKSGTALVGAIFQATTSSGATIPLRIDGVHALAAPNADVLVYAISYQTSSGWKALCAGANEAIPFPGTWNMVTVRHQGDANLFTLGCRGATFAKCYELGYKGDSKLDTYHQTCIRALRADYCGDGTSRTVNGTLINIYDNLGLQADTQAWPIESNWTPDGATCINKARVISLTAPDVPECVKVKAAVSCSTTWGSAIMRTEISTP